MSDEDMLEVMEAMAGKVERIEAQLQTIHSALATMTEIGLLTYAATGTKDSLPDEVINAPIAESGVMRNPFRIRVWRGTREEQERQAALLQGGAADIEAEIQRIRSLAPKATWAERLRFGHQIRALDAAMKRSFEREMGREMDRER